MRDRTAGERSLGLRGALRRGAHERRPSLHLVSAASQMGTNKCASQAGMTAYGTRRHLYDPKTQTDKPYDQTTISLQMGTNKGASQVRPPPPRVFSGWLVSQRRLRVEKTLRQAGARADGEGHTELTGKSSFLKFWFSAKISKSNSGAISTIKIEYSACSFSALS